MYRLIIADDELHIRESLATLVNWQALGFEVVGLAANGREVMAGLDALNPDALLMDIKMPFLTGLDVARHIDANRLPIRVVLLSGYQEFELAKDAANFGVYRYLLKPTKLEDVRVTFHALKETLDEQQKSAQAYERMVAAYHDSLRILRYQTLHDLLYLARPDALLQQIAQMENPLFLQHFCLVHLQFENLDAVLLDQWRHERDLFDTMLLNIARSAGPHMHCSLYPIEPEGFLLALNSNHVFRFKEFENTFQAELEQLLQCRFTLRAGNPFENLAMLRAEFQRLLPNAANLTDDEYEGLLLTAIVEGDAPRLAALLSALDTPAAWPVGRARQVRAHLARELTNMGLTVDAAELEEAPALRVWVNDCAARWRAYAAQSNTAERRLILRIKQFMRERLSEDLSLRRVADFVYLSPVYISRLFKQATGENFIDALQHMRVEKACQMLRNPALRIYEIATETGYRSAKYFMRVFKEYMRMTPTEYRRQVLHQDVAEDE